MSISLLRVKVAGSNQDRYQKSSRKLELSVDANVYWPNACPLSFLFKFLKDAERKCELYLLRGHIQVFA